MSSRRDFLKRSLAVAVGAVVAAGSASAMAGYEVHIPAVGVRPPPPTVQNVPLTPGNLSYDTLTKGSYIWPDTNFLGHYDDRGGVNTAGTLQPANSAAWASGYPVYEINSALGGKSIVDWGGMLTMVNYITLCGTRGAYTSPSDTTQGFYWYTGNLTVELDYGDGNFVVYADAVAVGKGETVQLPIGKAVVRIRVTRASDKWGGDGYMYFQPS